MLKNGFLTTTPSSFRHFVVAAVYRRYDGEDRRENFEKIICEPKVCPQVKYHQHQEETLKCLQVGFLFAS